MTETPITELPDGSGCFTSTILSTEEAMALPRSKRPLNYRISGDTYHAIFEAVGHASMCWKETPSGVFDCAEAEKCAVDLCFKVAKEVDGLHELNDSLAAKVAEWKARAEKAEAALKAAEDDRHLASGNQDPLSNYFDCLRHYSENPKP